MSPLLTPPESHTLLVLMDGNERAKRAAACGYKAGSRKLVELVRHIRDSSPRIERVVACVLSKENISKRASWFWGELHEALVEFGAAVMGGGLEGIRIELAGSLERLRQIGGHAAACADDFEAITERAGPSASSMPRLTLAVDYSSDIAISTRTTIVLRTGMQASGVVRTSGIDVCPSQMHCGTSTLWPELSMGEVDAMLDVALRHSPTSFAPGYDVGSLEGIIEAVAEEPGLPDVDVTIQSRSSRDDVWALLERLREPSRFARLSTAIMYVDRGVEEAQRFGMDRPARHQIRIVDRDSEVEAPPDGFEFIVAPGQHGAGFVLPEHPRLGYANVWASGAAPGDIVSTLSRGARDCFDNIPLLGASRHATNAATTSADLVGSCSVGAIEAFSRWAVSCGLFKDPAECPGAFSYLRTAFHIFDDTTAAEAVGKYMILVAVGDVLFDRELDEETPDSRLERLTAATTYLRGALCARSVPRRPPDIADSEILEAIARQWIAMYEAFDGAAPGELLSRWCSALEAHYASTVREYTSLVTNNPLVRRLAFGGEATDRAADAIIDRYVSCAPPSLAQHMRRLVADCRSTPSLHAEPLLELRVWLYLLDVNTIGAGLAFRTAALTAPRQGVTARAIAALDAVLPLLDFRVRLANDRSGFVMAMGRDRDRDKVSSCGLLIPEGASGVERAAALMRAMRITDRVAYVLDDALDAEMGELVASWPDMGAWVARGRRVGVHAYEAGHYTTLSADEFTSVLAAE